MNKSMGQLIADAFYYIVIIVVALEISKVLGILH